MKPTSQEQKRAFGLLTHSCRYCSVSHISYCHSKVKEDPQQAHPMRKNAHTRTESAPR